ncbi:MAG TPA: hypothetical protein VGH57_20025 [Amycolatopsis sp.]
MSYDLPPRRELPPEARERIRLRFRAALDQPARNRRPIWLVAAAVVLLAAGAVFATGVLRDDKSGLPPASRPGDLASSTLDRCWAAAQAEGRTGPLADRGQWVATAAESRGDDVVVAFTVGGKPVFCETTATTVTLSDPAAQPARPGGQDAGVLLYTATGVVAGVTDPSWELVEVSMPDGLGLVMVTPDRQTGQFIAFTGTDPAKTELWLGRAKPRQSGRLWPRGAVPRIPAPLMSVTDRSGDRSTPEGRALGECLSRVPNPPDGAAGYQPGAMLTDGANRLVLGQAPGHLIACVQEGTSYRLVKDTFIGQSIPVRRLSVPAVGGKVPFVGLVVPSAAEMTVEFTHGGGNSYSPTAVPIVNGTFAYWLAPDEVGDGNGNVYIQVDDAKKASLFNGPIPLK